MSVFDKYDLVEVSASAIPEIKQHLDGLVVIVGSSGSGKTSLMKAFGMKDHVFDTNTPIIELFDSEEIGEKCLISAGLRSVPTWKRPLSQVSNGERHRAEVAIMLSRGETLIDEFTSLVDRDTAKALCYSINKSKPKSLTLATCHRDVLQWLDFDYTFDVDCGKWIDRGSVRRDDKLELCITPCDTEEVWRVFKKHHYLSGKINKAASSWVALYNGKPVAMTSVLAFPSKNWKNGWRGHRTVVLPEFQGMGIGSMLSDTVADYIVSTGARFFSKTAHPALGEHREKSHLWKATSKNRVKRTDYLRKNKTKEDGHKEKHAHRVCYSHEYIGETKHD